MGCSSSSSSARGNNDTKDNMKQNNSNNMNYDDSMHIDEMEKQQVGTETNRNNAGPAEPIGDEQMRIAKRIRAIPFFNMHSFLQIVQIACAMEEIVKPANEVIFRVDDEEDAFYMVKDDRSLEAKLTVTDGTGSLRDMSPPPYFGETCLRYHNVKRRYTLTTLCEVVLLKISPSQYRSIIVRQAKQEENQYMSFLRKVPVLKGLTEEQLQALGRVLRHAKFSDGTKIITQGSRGSTFFFVESGTVKCIQRTQKGPTETYSEVNRYSAGDYFGEGALLQDAPRNADVIAVGDVTCLTLSRDDFNDILGGIQQLLEHNFRARVLKGVDLLSKLTDAERSEIADLLVEQVYDPGEQIIKQGDMGDRFYIIKEGEVRFTRDREPDNNTTSSNPLEELDTMHQQVLQQQQQQQSPSSSSSSSSTAQAVAAATAAAIAASSSSSFQIPQLPPPPPPYASSSSSSSSSSPIGSSVGGQHHQHVEDNGPIMNNSNKKEGGQDEIGRLFTGQYFGEGALLTDAPRRANAYAVGQVTLLCLERSIFNSVFDQSLQDMLNRNFEKRREAGAAVEFRDLEQIKVLGAGSYGQVLLVTNKVTGKTYALKSMSKQRIIATNQQKHVINERKILESVSHPFIVSLKQSYVSDEHVFVLLEAVLGGELFAYMRAAGRIKLKDAIFYMAQVVLVFEYLHSRNIIYRDLKPENLLVAANGYLKFTDFGLSKLLNNNNKTYTLCGTPAYAAPEVYTLVGHGKAVDWWTLGVLTHELLSATTPFDGDAHEIFAQMEEYARAYPNIRLPRGLSGDVGDFVLRLLNPNPNKRLGCLPRGGGARDVKMHSLFKFFPWTKLIQEQLKAPFRPTIKSMYDTGNFYTPNLKTKPITLEHVDPNSVKISAEWTF